MPQILRPLRHRQFALLWSGQTVSWVGNILYEVALMWFVLVLTGSTTAMAGVALLSAVPQLIFGPFAGVVADRVNRRLLALSMDAGRMVIVFLIPALAVLHLLTLWEIYAGTFLLWTCFTFFLPARTSLLANLVPEDELRSAMALMQTSMQSSWLIGAAAGGALVAAVGSIPALYIDAATFIASIGTLACIKSSGFAARPEEMKHSTTRFLLDGWKFIRHDAPLRTILIVMLAISLLTGPYIVLEAPFSRLVLHTGALGYGLLQGGFTAGSVVGSILAGSLPRVRRVGLVLVGVMVAVAPLTIAFSLSRVLILAILWLLLIGVLSGFINVPLITLIQKRTPDAMRGRVNSVLGMSNGAAVPISIAVTGFLVQPFGIPGTYRLSAYAFVVLGATAAFMGLASLRDEPDEPEAAIQKSA